MGSNQRRLGRGCAAAFGVFAAGMLAAPLARADGITRVSTVFFGSATASSLDDKKFAVGAANTEPDVLRDKNLRVDGAGAMSGGGFRLVIDWSRTRVGLGMNIFGAEGYQLRHDPLTKGIHLATGTFWGETIDLFAGRQWHLWGMRPYVDLRVAFTILQANVKLTSDSYGVLGSTPYNAYSFGLGPRAGLIIPMNSWSFIDLSVYGSPIGPEKLAGTLGIGLGTPDDNEEIKPRRRRRSPPATW